jgi:hypothetical protein
MKRMQVMHRVNCHFTCFTAVLALLAGLPAWAGAQILFQYGTDATPPTINPNVVPGFTPGTRINQAGVGNPVSPAGATSDAAGSGADVVVGTLSVTELSTTLSYLDDYGPTPIQIMVGIRDTASGDVGQYTFNGSLTGQAARLSVVSFATISNPFAASSQTQVIGGNSYTVSIDPAVDFTKPGAAPLGGTGTAGTYTFHVQASSAAVPESGSLALLGGLAIPGVTLLRRRRV